MNNMTLAGKPATVEPVHFAYIDGIRGLAFLAVLSVHSALVPGHFPGQGFFRQGAYGVQLFFLVSAVTLCHSQATRQKADRLPVVSFYLRRLFRIMPMFWLAMVFYWTVPGVMPPGKDFFAGGDVYPVYFLLTATCLHGWHPCTFNSIVPGGWSVAVEMTFYAVFPALFYWLGGSLRRSAAVLLVGLGFLVGVPFLAVWLRYHYFLGVQDDLWDFFNRLWFPAQLPVFLTGMLAYQLARHPTVRSVVQDRFWSGWLLMMGGLLFFSFLTSFGWLLPNYVPVVFDLAGLVVLCSGNQLRWLVNPWLCRLGKISYSCYLLHFACLTVAERLLGIPARAKQPLVDTGLAAGNLLVFAKVFLVTLGLTVVVANIARHLVENPGIALGRRVIQWVNSPRVRA